MAKVLANLDIPTTDDTDKLSAELRKLARQVTALEKQLKAKPKAAPKKATVKKAAAPKVEAKKAMTVSADKEITPVSKPVTTK